LQSHALAREELECFDFPQTNFHFEYTANLRSINQF